MHAAPAVSVSCSGGLPWRLTQALLPALASAAVASWGLEPWELATVWAWTVAGLVFVACWRLARPHPIGLRFDGVLWSVDDRVGSVEVLIDLGWVMLLRWRPHTGGAKGARGAARYVGLTAAEIGAAMHGLRVALYARGSAAPSVGR